MAKSRAGSRAAWCSRWTIMSLIIEILPWGREAVRGSIVGVSALVGIDAGQPSDHRLIDAAAADSSRCTSRNQIGPLGFYCGVRPYLPLRGCCCVKRGILPTRTLALCAVYVLATGRRIFDSI